MFGTGLGLRRIGKNGDSCCGKPETDRCVTPVIYYNYFSYLHTESQWLRSQALDLRSAGPEFESRHVPMCFSISDLDVSDVLTMKENIVMQPAHYLKRNSKTCVKSTNPHLASVVEYGLVTPNLGILGLGSAQLVQFGQCNANIALQTNFNPTRFLGTWYGIARAENNLQNGDCAVLELTQNNNVINVTNTAVNNNFYGEITGTATLEQGTAKYTLRLDGVHCTAVDFWILTTDYDNFAVGYACQNIGNVQRSVYLWQLGRATTYPTEMMEALVNTTINNLLGIDTSDLRRIDHSENACYVLPEIANNESVILPGQCNTNMSVVTNFNAARFGGVWHQISRYYTENEGGSCNRAEYTLSGAGVNVLNSQVVNQRLETISGRATVSTTDGSAKLTVNLEVAPNARPVKYNDNYAVSYNCVNLDNNRRRVRSWILSRQRQLSGTSQQAVNEVIRSEIDLNTRFFLQTDQSDAGCFYFPDPVAGQPVVFPGQCDLSIPAMPAFQPDRYMGLWHDIESYPSVFQNGSCNNALYTLTGGTVRVFNTQVVNQRLDTMEGVAVLASTDGTAKLKVSFPIAGTNLTTSTDYWVLDTDYVSYSLVYTCTNMGNDQRQVYAWKLSRTKQLTAVGNIAINTIINNVQVLDQRYFVAKDQSPEGCFFYPEPQTDVPVRFPGQCDVNVPVVTGFSLQQFQGVWYEVEAYPKEQQTGQCVYHTYSTGTGNTLNLVSSSVTDQFLGLTNSVLAFQSTDSSGRLTLRIQTNTGEVVIPFWILSINYNDFALAYSCINDGSDFRKIFSWKLSRTKQLSAAANTAMNSVMANNVVLDNQYYQAIDQSDRACFFLPDIPLGQPVVLPGQCNVNIPVVQNFNVARYLGRWRLIETYFTEQQSGTCNDATYTLNNNVVDVYNTQVINQQLDTINGTATLATTDGSAKLLVNFPGTSAPADYWVLDTDYDSYALVYSCRNINAQEQRVFAWKLSRTRNLTPTAINNINSVINSVDVLNNRYFEIVDQSDSGCFYYPVPSNSPVIFRGQCDPNIRVVTGFDVARYLNLWHDIESYPTPFQDGSCPNAFYELGDGVVDVFNTQVINQTLDTIRGEATLRESTDGSAKLLVTFPIVGTNLNITTDYWVLSTDYSSYALVYSCTNLDDERSQVSSWKLSRTKQLTTQATTAINSVISTIPVLDQRYYQIRDQSVTGCFYYPEPELGKPVVFPGQCDTNIAAVPNFNLNLFSGTWHEIEAYPKDQQSGQCISHQYTLDSPTNSLNLASFNVLNETLRTSNGVVTINSLDNSGRLLITLTEGNERVVIPFWVLSTDYSNYALAYSCVNRGSDYRAVYSWKLSRNKQLSTAANTAINNAIANIEVLDNRYYETIDQSNDACFYLPTIAPGQPVILPGECDPNISVVQNFNPVRYMGRWRMIESYESDFQSGNCNEANYRLLENATVDVSNTQVVNQNLEVVNGSAVLATTDGSAKLLVSFPNAPAPSEYWILATDYDNYALVYSCRNLNNQQRRGKKSRTRQLSASAANSINQVVDRVNVLNSRYYQSIQQSDAACFYYPEPAPNTPVIFRGQCDPNIPVVTNFNLGQYLGLWHDISSYPTVFQFGTCSNAFYTLNGGVVDVFNTQVVNQTLDTIRGVATLVADPQNSAKVIVSFPIAGTNLTTSTDYWVLSTDYSSYALVYSCRNIDDERRSVGSWKLSRTKQLSAAANTVINNVINTVPVLDNRYFNDVDQSRDGCFYYPEPEPGVPVIFPGQCDTNIQAVPSFNLTQFTGTWYEIEAYPKDQQTGQCVNHQYTSATTATLNLQSFNVLNETLRITSSVVSVTSTDGSGRLLITLREGTQTIQIPFWVLSTDYNTYALAYSCVNRDSDFRAIYSWKLSRTKTLSAASNTAINTAIANIEVLDNRYYENIDQSDSACFYLPDLGPNDPVVFPGQCDQTIPVVQNFDPVRYQGRWRMIETYQSDFQAGTCNEANYMLTPNSTVDVVNTQVVNQQLQTETAVAVLATTDGSGKLIVTFPNAPQSSEYWILGTDYSNYALVYSCRNINSQQRRVWSWKLSRDRQLSAASANAINQIINRVDVLNPRYYQSIVQTDAACFYFPTPAPNRPVVFRGQCDMNIPVVTNFRLADYLGLWYDIESYPSVFQGGTCSNALYTLNGTVVDVFNTQVINQTLDTINGVATLTPDPNNSAKIVVSFPIAGTNQTTSTDYWVLSTDYSSYALVYTCFNLDAERRQGQCDNTIQAVPNFNLTQFQGRWFEIQAYPKDQQTGQCVTHQYSQVNGSTADLESFNVQGQELFMSESIVSITSTDSSGRLLITLTEASGSIQIPFWILSTDYNNYALAYSCVNRGNDFRAVYSWKLSRTKQLSAAANTNINNAIANIPVLDNVYYEDIDQSDEACFFLPELPPGSPVEFVGQCDPNITVVQNFDPVRYAGRWRLIETYESDFQSGACNEATYTLTPNGTVDVFNTQVINQTLDTMTGSAVLATTDNTGKLLVTFPGTSQPSDYWILDTDYDSYALVYSCRNINTERRRVWSWKLSRTRSLSVEAERNINNTVNNINVLNERYYQKIEHTDNSCFYYPSPDGTPVVFRGQCDESIDVVRNFNLNAYMGLWYDIESYPQEFQDGTCATATYNLTANGVDVFNTQVVNQQLDTINANAVPASTDGSAKFTVTFPIAGTNATISTPYWVLATDYNSYALVYSCSNINTESRRVTSWKLSRQTNLTVLAEQVINNVIATVPVLRNDYYVPRGHTEDDCFYYPDNNGGPVILNGVCEEQTPVTGFNVNAFGGTWYEAARFPSELQRGECASKTISSSQNTVMISESYVNNERLDTINFTAITATDGRGILNTTLTDVTGVTFDATIYVLATDYTDYALLFSCRNLGNQSKQIYSWKLSRSQTGLSQSANNTINQVVSSTTDLFENYYETSDQSNAACFHYPVFDEMPPAITLPGPCDQSIRAKANFNAAGFAGTWIEIARYPQASQRGQCNRPLYDLLGNTFEVINTQVINQTLDTINGEAVVSSTDGSGIVTVTFRLPNDVVNVATLYILETDYTNYALLYSCRNMSDNRRQVNSWKLSRTTTLSNEANNVINNIVNNTEGLLNDYYMITDQSEEACFYIPEVFPNMAPIFRGQCEDITGVQGFDMQRYLGWWHEIERYPSDDTLGDCISSEFVTSGNQFQVVDTNVFGDSAVVNTSTITVTNNGRLRKTLSNGRVIDMWVLATDYETYSLLYSCENVNQEYRRVWSAKHSKSRQLTQAAQNAMAPIITNNRVLYPQFYLPVNQSDNACFHYPVQTGRQIILPGQCDMNIPAVMNFDAAQYTGTWYQIERYPQFHENGACTGARYTLNEATGVVTLLNWEVVEGVLDTIEGTATINSTDGSARLVVTLPDRLSDDPAATVTTRLYVLTTDYVSYSLAYSCVNVNQFQRSVGVWKLSRTRTMPAAGTTAINTYMATREELHQPYFVQVQQNDDCEEPSSAILVKSSIIVMLICVALQMFV
ncbi:Apolipoprotein D [Papilio xuthus]|uniref:Apolipoprotein D n=1 Tax=Papilio xuthus TaxID=66420 RepID=A0A194PFV2_PAPXU|nr:Apolipoprotein D [Papilio xuthus]